VDAVVECSWRLEGTTVRVTAQLIDATNGYRVWGKQYERELREPFALQDAIVKAIVKELAIELEATDAAELAARPTEDLDAYDLYWQGRSFFNKRTRAPRAAIPFFRLPRTRSGYALAYSGLADTVQLQLLNAVPRQEACLKARPAALKRWHSIPHARRSGRRLVVCFGPAMMLYWCRARVPPGHPDQSELCVGA
jgi:hypothetical protein